MKRIMIPALLCDIISSLYVHRNQYNFPNIPFIMFYRCCDTKVLFWKHTQPVTYNTWSTLMKGKCVYCLLNSNKMILIEPAEFVFQESLFIIQSASKEEGRIKPYKWSSLINEQSNIHYCHHPKYSLKIIISLKFP